MVLKDRAIQVEIGLASFIGASPLALRYAKYLEHQPSMCPLQRIVGVSCPSCGGTRAAFYLWGAHPSEALQANAGVTAFLVACIGLALYGQVIGQPILGVAEGQFLVAD